MIATCHRTTVHFQRWSGPNVPAGVAECNGLVLTRSAQFFQLNVATVFPLGWKISILGFCAASMMHVASQSPLIHYTSAEGKESVGRKVEEKKDGSEAFSSIVKKQKGAETVTMAEQTACRRTPRFESFVMTGEKILCLTPKISESYAKLKRLELPEHMEIATSGMATMPQSFQLVEPSTSGSSAEPDSLNESGQKISSMVVAGNALHQEEENFTPTCGNNKQIVDGHVAATAIGDKEKYDNFNSISDSDTDSDGDGDDDDDDHACKVQGNFGVENVEQVEQEEEGEEEKVPIIKASDTKDVDELIIAEASSIANVEQSPPCSSRYDGMKNGSTTLDKLTQLTRLHDNDDAYSLNSTVLRAGGLETARRLARRLYQLDGFKPSDVYAHISKSDDFSMLVSQEYMKMFNFSGFRIDAALRCFLTYVLLSPDQMVLSDCVPLALFSQRYHKCNPCLFNSEDEILSLVCSLLALDLKLHAGSSKSCRITCHDFIESTSQAGYVYSRDLLKKLYSSLKRNPLRDFAQVENGERCSGYGNSILRPNPRMMPDSDSQVEYKKGWVMRKCVVDKGGKKVPFGRRTWRMFYAILKGTILYLQKDEGGAKSGAYITYRNAIGLHHSFAERAVDYTKKQHVFKLQTYTYAEYLFQTSDPNEVASWIHAINFIAACFSAPKPIVVDESISNWSLFGRPTMSTTMSTKLSMTDQLKAHGDRVMEIERLLEAHRDHPPCRNCKPNLLLEFAEKEVNLLYELKRYKKYVEMLQDKVDEYASEEENMCESAYVYSVPTIASPGGRSDIKDEERNFAFYSMNQTVLISSSPSSVTQSKHISEIILIIQANAAFLAFFLDWFIFSIFHKHTYRKLDVCAITNFAIGNMLCAVGTFLSTCHRFYVIKHFFNVEIWKCIFLFIYFPVIQFGRDSAALSLLFCAFERLAFFTHPKLHRRMVEQLASNSILLLGTTAVAVLDLVAISIVASPRFDQPIAAFCLRSEVISQQYMKIYSIIRIALGVFEALQYGISFFALIHNSRVLSATCLNVMRRQRDRYTLRCLMMVFACSFATQIIPWTVSLNLTQNSWHVSAFFKLLAKLETCILPLPPLLFLLVHPDLRHDARRVLAKKSCFNCKSKIEKQHAVYIGSVL
ncbi:PH and SEC7 domain-containing protein 3 [Trichinella britovi]|uniref:PH and SEC7 domain-containing protein 3 n=1 Tax=Trichinella britovi TaxID=45882 RepID=A0A0V1CBA7_TRIBR|nr:PH and SEC7 domain-containing protein 3 [Trichinella britovi]